MYDPITDPFPNPWQGYPESFWASTVTPEKGEALHDQVDADVAVIGAGYTGLSAAYHLQQKYRAKVVVIDANEIGWGCSGRNAGFVLGGTGRLSLNAMSQKWGAETAGQVYQEYLDAIDTVKRLIQKGNIDCDLTQGGYIKLAHNGKAARDMQRQVALLEPFLGKNVTYLSDQEVGDQLVRTSMAYGGLHFPNYFGLNPLKLVLGYSQLARQAGVKVFTNSPVTQFESKKNKHVLMTPSGSVTADKVIIATNGYTPKHLHSLVQNRHFPVLSSIIVTRPLSPEELDSINMHDGLMAMDSRAMKFYYRLLPDNRLLFGGRGAIRGKDAGHQVYAYKLQQGLARTFPSLRHIDAAFYWSGWVSVSLDDFPRIWTSEDKSLAYAMGYCGSGVSFTAQAGKRLAQTLAGDTDMPDLPFWQSPLPRFPFARFRRLGLRAFYALASLNA